MSLASLKFEIEFYPSYLGTFLSPSEPTTENAFFFNTVVGLRMVVELQHKCFHTTLIRLSAMTASKEDKRGSVRKGEEALIHVTMLIGGLYICRCFIYVHEQYKSKVSAAAK